MAVGLGARACGRRCRSLLAQPPAPVDPGGRLAPEGPLPMQNHLFSIYHRLGIATCAHLPFFLLCLLPFPLVLCCLSLAFSISSISSDLLQRYPKYLETTHYLCKNVLVRLRPPKRETLILTDAINQGSIHFLLTWLRCEVSAVSVTGASQAENFR